MMLNRKRRQRSFMKAAQDEFFLARVRIDVADGEDSRNAGLKLLGVDLERPLFHLQAPFRNGPKLRMQAKECEYMIHRNRARLSVGGLHLEPGQSFALLVQDDGI